MLSGELYEYKCNNCGGYGTSMAKLCHCEYCGSFVKGKSLKEESNNSSDEGETYGN